MYRRTVEVCLWLIGARVCVFHLRDFSSGIRSHDFAFRSSGGSWKMGPSYAAIYGLS